MDLIFDLQYRIRYQTKYLNCIGGGGGVKLLCTCGYLENEYYDLLSSSSSCSCDMDTSSCHQLLETLQVFTLSHSLI